METRGLFGIVYVPFLSLFPLLEPIFLKHVFSEQKQENLFWYACIETFFFGEELKNSVWLVLVEIIF